MSSFAISPASIASDDIPQTPDVSHDDGVLLASAAANLSFCDGDPDAVCTTISGPYSTGIKKSYAGIGTYSPPFIRHSVQSESDDVFGSPTKRSGSNPENLSASSKQDAMKGSWRSGSSSGCNSDAGSPSSHQIKEHLSEGSENALAIYHEAVKSEDSQALYHPSACVFVANLLQSESEPSLEAAVTQVFSEFGKVFVKIRRDHNHMPFAFCQFTDPKHAERAIKEGRGRLIKGRPCRCEKAKAHRLFFVESKYGPAITPDETVELLEPFGKLESCKSITQLERASMNVNDGVLVQFVMYDQGQAANSALRNHDHYKMTAIGSLAASPCRLSGPLTSPSSNADSKWLANYDIDRRSIFIRNLPVGTKEYELEKTFLPFGAIRKVEVHEQRSNYEPYDMYSFGFVEFKNPTSVSAAIMGKDGASLGEKTLRISQKDSNVKSRRISSVEPPAYQSPAPSTAQQQVSPSVTQLASPPFATPNYNTQNYGTPSYSNPGYCSPYNFGFNTPYYGYLTPESQGQYQLVSPYSALNYYVGSPTYSPGVPSTTGVTGSPNSQHQSYTNTGTWNYGGVMPYQSYPYCGMTTLSPPQQPNQWHQNASAPIQNAQDSPEHATVGEDRSTTPTPSGHTPVVTSSMETSSE